MSSESKPSAILSQSGRIRKQTTAHNNIVHNHALSSQNIQDRCFSELVVDLQHTTLYHIDHIITFCQLLSSEIKMMKAGANNSLSFSSGLVSTNSSNKHLSHKLLNAALCSLSISNWVWPLVLEGLCEPAACCCWKWCWNRMRVNQNTKCVLNQLSELKRLNALWCWRGQQLITKTPETQNRDQHQYYCWVYISTTAELFYSSRWIIVVDGDGAQVSIHCNCQSFGETVAEEVFRSYTRVNGIHVHVNTYVMYGHQNVLKVYQVKVLIVQQKGPYQNCIFK